MLLAFKNSDERKCPVSNLDDLRVRNLRYKEVFNMSGNEFVTRALLDEKPDRAYVFRHNVASSGC